MSYDKTLNLPKTNFSMKANLTQKEPGWLEFWEKEDIYHKMLAINEGSKSFILHDGPPYANGDIHLGHALNKILKDTIVRYKSMSGYYSPYVPGWDCHGLPTEQEVAKRLKIDRKTVSITEWRQKCRQTAWLYINRQREQFKRLGVLGEWDNPYITLDNAYEATQINVFAEMYFEGYLYRDFKTVLWCTHCETSLADAEIEYEAKYSHSIYVKFPLVGEPGTFFLIWTTTPWTLPGNRAIAVHPEGKYVIAEFGSEKIILLAERLSDIQNQTGLKNGLISKTVLGKELAGLRYYHPLLGTSQKTLIEDWVSLEEGTGIVHIAPGHGEIDHLTGKKHGLDLHSPVDERGVLTGDAGQFAGLSYKDAEKEILQYLTNQNLLFWSGKLQHSYPHCWRCHKPVIYRAALQWFVDVEKYRTRALESIDEVKWLPEGTVNRIKSMIESRPDWCLSRQRTWGVPIPVFYCKNCQEVVLNKEIIQHLTTLFLQYSSDIWFENDEKQLLPPDTRCFNCQSDIFEKEKDIMDVWFDSGISHYAVLEKRKELGWPADLYLEGSDQHRGWFQTSLLTSVPLKHSAPYRIVFTSGWIVDEKGRTMHKSLGNVISPLEVINKHGADVLRLTLTGSDFSRDVSVSKDILEQFSNIYRKIRNTLRFMLGNLQDYKETEEVAYADLGELNQWILHRLNNLVSDVSEAMDEYKFHRFHHLLHDFCEKDLSAFYLDVLKDRLYVLQPTHPRRKSAQTTLYYILSTITSMISPILPFTSEEVFAELKQISNYLPITVHLTGFPTRKEGYFRPDLEEKYSKVLYFREEVNQELEKSRRNNLIGSSLEAKVTIYADKKSISFLEQIGIKELEDIFIVSKLDLQVNDNPLENIHISHYEGQKCERCWKWSVSVGKNGEHPTICSRCVQEVSGLKA